MDERTTRKVPVEEIEMDHRGQARADVNHDAVAEYADAYRAGVVLPPPEVFLVSGKLYLVDGYHRVPAAMAVGVGFLRVVIVGEGTIDDAIWYATGVNQSHGVRRSNADKRRAVWMALESPIGQEQSSRTIAEHCGVSGELVAKVRAEWEAKQVLERAPESDGDEVLERAPEQHEPKRRGKDGKLYPAKPRETASRSEPPITDEAALPFEPEDRPGQKAPDYGPTLLEAAKRVREARLFALRSVPEAIELNGMRQRFEALMKQAQTALEMAEPVACPKCGNEGCPYCGSAGWVPRQVVAR